MNANNTNPNNAARNALFTLIGLAMLLVTTGCDTYGLGSEFGNYLGGYDYSGYNIGGYDFSFPGTGYYDPTYDIQSVIGYRQDAMDWSNAGWDDYIMQ
jgi:hypothetical protein